MIRFVRKIGSSHLVYWLWTTIVVGAGIVVVGCSVLKVLRLEYWAAGLRLGKVAACLQRLW